MVEWGLSKSEIARTLKVPLGTIKSIFKGHTWFNIGINFKEINVRRKNRWEEDKKLPIKYLEYLKELDGGIGGVNYKRKPFDKINFK